MGLLSPEVEKTAVKTIVGVDSNVIVKVFHGLLEHHPEEDAEQSRCQDASLFHAVDDGEGFREVAV